MDQEPQIHPTLLMDPDLVREMARECEEAGLVFEDEEELLEFLSEVLTYGTEEGEFTLPDVADTDVEDDADEDLTSDE